MLKKFLTRNSYNRVIQILILCTPILSILYFEIFRKLYFPITDDWLYIPWGSHQVNPGNITDFELVGGHQQVITKYSIWLLGFAPRFYLPYVGILNFAFAVAGYLLLIIASVKYIGKSVNFFFLLCFFIIAFTFKPFYMYMTATALGPMQAVFLIGIYYYIKNSPNKLAFNWILWFVIFLSPFTTGLGMIIPMTEILENLYLLIRKKICTRRNVLMLTSAMTGLFLSYALQMIKKNFDPRAMMGERSLTQNILGSLSNPLGAFKFMLSMMGSILTPSSRYDPILPMMLGVLFLIFLILFLFNKIHRSDIEDIFLNKNSFMGGFCFILLLIITRFGGVQSEIVNATAPRYITGYIVFLLGVLSLLVKKNYYRKIFIYLLTLITSLVLISGIKTGLEWQKIRWFQTESVTKCINEDLKYNKNISQTCLDLAFQLRRANTDLKTFNDDFYNYLRVSELIFETNTK